MFLGTEKAFGATYYISYTDGDDTRTAIQAQSSSTPWKTVSKIAGYAASLSNGDIIKFKRGDTWAERLLVAHDNLTFTNYGDTVANPPIFTGASGYSMRTDRNGQTFNGLWFQNGQGYVSNSVTGITTFSYCIFSDNVPSIAKVFMEFYGGTGSINNSVFLGGTSYAVNQHGTSTLTLNNNMFLGQDGQNVYVTWPSPQILNTDLV